MATTNDSKAPLRQVKRVQFGIISPDEIVSCVYRKSETYVFKCDSSLWQIWSRIAINDEVLVSRSCDLVLCFILLWRQHIFLDNISVLRYYKVALLSKIVLNWIEMIKRAVLMCVRISQRYFPDPFSHRVFLYVCSVLVILCTVMFSSDVCQSQKGAFAFPKLWKAEDLSSEGLWTLDKGWLTEVPDARPALETWLNVLDTLDT